MGLLDWTITGLYTLSVIVMSFLVGRRQKSREDYFLGGRKVPYWLVGSSLMANQVSAISLIGAPAFIAVRAGGGLRWLQYELAIPLAMVFIMLVLVPVYWKTGGITIYEYLERRFGTAARSALSLVFLISRSMGAGVILLATSYVTAVLLKLDLALTIVLIGGISLLYTSVGGIIADIYTDFLQLIILWAGSAACLILLIIQLNGRFGFPVSENARMEVFRFASTGLGDGDTFSFWPMIFGGFFLYISYYGCDQSQAQRLLATANAGEARKALLFNGILRFPVVITYCAIGLLMIPFINGHPGFKAAVMNAPPDYLMPLFFTRYVPAGVLGIIISGILAASMSSLDSAINSLSAATWNDFLDKSFPRLGGITEKAKVRFSRFISAAWGCASTGFAIAMSGRPETVIELINKIGSAFYGPIAGLFVMGIAFRGIRQGPALAGLTGGVTVNILLWLFYEKEVSWMWWNFFGFFTTVGTGLLAGIFHGETIKLDSGGIAGYIREGFSGRYALMLAAWFVIITAFCAAVEMVLR